MVFVMDTDDHVRPILRSFDLRYCLTSILDQERHRDVAVAELVETLHRRGVGVAGRPSKAISDVLRSEIRKGRVIRTARGRYRAVPMPRTTRFRIRTRAAALFADPEGECRYW